MVRFIFRFNNIWFKNRSLISAQCQLQCTLFQSRNSNVGIPVSARRTCDSEMIIYQLVVWIQENLLENNADKTQAHIYVADKISVLPG